MVVVYAVFVHFKKIIIIIILEKERYRHRVVQFSDINYGKNVELDRILLWHRK